MSSAPDIGGARLTSCGGNPWAATFLDSVRFLDQLGRFAKHGVSVIFHNTLASSEYGLLDQHTFLPGLPGPACTSTPTVCATILGA